MITVIYGNRGNVDALAVPLYLTVPSNFRVGTLFPLAPPPPRAGEDRPDWFYVPMNGRLADRDRVRPRLGFDEQDRLRLPLRDRRLVDIKTPVVLMNDGKRARLVRICQLEEPAGELVAAGQWAQPGREPVEGLVAAIVVPLDPGVALACGSRRLVPPEGRGRGTYASIPAPRPPSVGSCGSA